jgi:hypothetical protein
MTDDVNRHTQQTKQAINSYDAKYIRHSGPTAFAPCLTAKQRYSNISLRHHYKVTRFYFQHETGTKIPIPMISLSAHRGILTWGLFKVWDNTDIVKKSTETLTDASKEVGLEINVEKFMCVLLSRHQNACPNRDVKTANRSFENVSQLKYLGTTVTNTNMIQAEIKRRLNCGNACYHSTQDLLSSRLMSKT